MLTPKEFSSQKFDKVLMWGYDMAQVDSFFERAEADYAALYQENSSLNAQVKELSEKTAEPSEDFEPEVKIFPAEKPAENPSSDASEDNSPVEVEREALLREQEALLLERKKLLHEREALLGELEGLNRQIAAEKQRLQDARRAAGAYIDQLLSRYAAEEKYFSALRDGNAASSADSGSAPSAADLVSEPTIVASASGTSPSETPVSEFTKTFPPYDPYALRPTTAEDTKTFSAENPSAEDVASADTATDEPDAENADGLLKVRPLPESDDFLNPFWEDLWDNDAEAPVSDSAQAKGSEIPEDLSDDIKLPAFSMSASPRSKASPASKPHFELSKLSLSDFIQKFGGGNGNKQ